MPPPAKKTKTTATTPMPPPAKKTKTTATTLTSILSLPHDLLLNCLARISRLYYPTLSLVSKSFRSLIASPELYKLRSLLGHTESCLYVCYGYCSDLRWFTLRRKPDENLTSTGYVSAEVPIPPFSRTDYSTLVVVGSNIYKIGINFSSPSCSFSSPSSSFSILDCTSHTWREAPSLPVELVSLSASVVDRKIYVAGCSGFDSLEQNAFNVFDTTKQTWDPEPIPCREAKTPFFNTQSACIAGKFHMRTMEEEELTYNSKEGRWDVVEQGIGDYLSSNAYCEIGNVLYCAWRGTFKWFDTEVSYWRNVEGLEGVLPLPSLPFLPSSELPLRPRVRLADYSGKMAVLFDDGLPYWGAYGDMKMVWCAVIELEKRKSCEIWGKVEWLDYVLPIPTNYDLMKVLAVTV